MNKSDLVKSVAAKLGSTTAEAEKAVTAVMGTVFQGIQQGGVEYLGFGNFSLVKREPRTARNPRTGEEVAVPAKNVVKFKASKKLDAAVNP